jgi:hypothetical protein
LPYSYKEATKNTIQGKIFELDQKQITVQKLIDENPYMMPAFKQRDFQSILKKKKSNLNILTNDKVQNIDLGIKLDE